MGFRPINLDAARPAEYRRGFGVRGYLVSLLIELRIWLSMLLFEQLFLLEIQRMRAEGFVTKREPVRGSVVAIPPAQPEPPATPKRNDDQVPERPLRIEDSLLARTLADVEGDSNRSLRYFRSRSDHRISTYGEEGEK